MMYYFAYGMNTNAQEMAWRCPAAKDLGTARLDNHRLVFKYHADMIESPVDTALGVLWRITPACLVALDQLEGYPYYYQRRTVEVVTESGCTVPALMYYMTNSDEPSEPSTGYYKLVLEGYTQHGISEKELEKGLINYNSLMKIY